MKAELVEMFLIERDAAGARQFQVFSAHPQIIKDQEVKRDEPADSSTKIIKLYELPRGKAVGIFATKLFGR